MRIIIRLSLILVDKVLFIFQSFITSVPILRLNYVQNFLQLFYNRVSLSDIFKNEFEVIEFQVIDKGLIESQCVGTLEFRYVEFDGEVFGF